MKKILCIINLALLLSLSACSQNNSDATLKPSRSEVSTTNISGNSTSETKSLVTQPTQRENNQLPLPQENLEFSFLSGAGAWRTIITLNSNGTFSGWYLDSEMGEIGEDYPNGSAYTCTFFGKFDNIKKLNEYSYKMTLTDIKTEKTVGEEWIEDEIRYIASEPFGLNDPVDNRECTEFIFYLPNTPINQLPQEFLTWWPYRYHQETEEQTTLTCYAILNVSTNYGFFTTE